MSKLINQKFIEGIDSSKFKIAANGALMAVDGSGNLVELLKLNPSGAALLLGVEVASKSALESLVSDLTAHIASNEASFSEMDGRLDSIESEMPNKASISYVNEQDEATLAASKLYADQRVSDLVNGAPEILDTLKEISDALGGDANLAGTLTGQISSVQSGLTSEISRATAAEIQALVDAKAYADTKVAEEAAARIAADSSNLARIQSLEDLSIAQVIHVSKSGNDTTGNGGQHKPFLTLTKAFSMITDASPTKRYVVRVASGNYTEASVALPANVFVIGEQKEAVRITGSVSMGASFNTGSSTDDRSGFSMVTLLSACDFNWATVQSRAGKLYLNEVVFGSTVSMYGHNNAIAQAQFDSCVIFGALTISGINVGVFNNNTCYSNVTLNQHPNGGMASILVATGGYCSGNVRFITTANDFNRRSAGFLRGFSSENLIVDGPSSYCDHTIDSGSKNGAQSLNGGNLVPMNTVISHRIVPNVTNSHNLGDWGKQWMFNFAYIHASSGTDLYLSSVGASYDAAGDDAGRAIHIEADGYGLKPNVSGGDINLLTASTSGTGVRGKIKLDAREIDASSKKITSLASGTDSADAVNKGQLDAAVVESKAHSDSAVAVEKARAEAAEAALQSAVSAESSARSDADSALDGRVAALEAKPSLNLKNKYGVLGAGDLMHIDLDHQALEGGIIALYVDRTIVYPGMDFTISVVEGKTRITWAGELANPDGSYAVVEGDDFYCVYAI
jgi:hypothetical protein